MIPYVRSLHERIEWNGSKIAQVPRNHTTNEGAGKTNFKTGDEHMSQSSCKTALAELAPST